MASPVTGRILVALNDGPLVASPTWTRLDTLADNFYAGCDIDYGRQSETDRSDTGTCRAYFNDTERTGALLDPANTGSPLFGLLDGKQVLVQVQDPTTGDWEEQFRGVIDDITFDIPPSQVVANVALECVDVFDYLAGCQMAPGLFGDPTAADKAGTILYEDTAGTINQRIEQALTDAGVDPAMYVVFTGNVSGAEGTYDAGDSVLSVLRDAADAEFPGVGNIYVDRKGRFCFHGRRSRIDPDTVAAGAGAAAWDFQRWKLGDGAAIQADPDTAQIRVLAYSRGRRDVINAALAWPRFNDAQTDFFPQEEIPDNIYTDATSITDYGYHALPPMEDLLVKAGTTTGNGAKAECLLFATLYVLNRKDPQTRVKRIAVKALRPSDPRAAATWPVLTRADISDVANVTATYPGGVGIQNADYFIEGVSKRIRPLNPEHDYVEVEFDLSPVWTDWTGAL